MKLYLCMIKYINKKGKIISESSEKDSLYKKHLTILKNNIPH